MSETQSLMDTLRSFGSEQTLKTFVRHGIPADRAFGCKVPDLKVVAKSIKGRQDLAYELYATGNYDAMYLAGMVATGEKMDREKLCAWAEGADGIASIAEYTVAWVAIENPEASSLAVEWIKSDKEHVAAAGWSTYSGLVTTQEDSKLDLKEIESLLDLAVKDISRSPDRVKSAMNRFLIAVGSYVKPLNERAKQAAAEIGELTIDVGDTACKVPLAADYIAKAETSGKVGQKRKTIRC